MFNFDLTRILLTLPGLVIGFVFHEFAHALVADRLGDPTPRNQGKLSLDPRVHIDPVGFLFILFFNFGWAKPVMVNTRHFKKPRRDDILVSAAGPLTNLLIAIFFALVMKLVLSLGLSVSPNENLIRQALNLFNYTIWINVLLFVLNFLPIPGFDGYHVLVNIIPLRNYRIIYFLEQYAMIIFILLIMTRISSFIIGVPASAVFSLIMKVFNI